MDTFGILGFMFGMMGFVFSMSAMGKVGALEKRVAKLETTDENGG